MREMLSGVDRRISGLAVVVVAAGVVLSPSGALAQSARQLNALEQRWSPAGFGSNIEDAAEPKSGQRPPNRRQMKAFSVTDTTEKPEDRKRTTITLSGGATGTYTTNVFRTRSGQVSDFGSVTSFGANVATVLDWSSELTLAFGVGLAFERFSNAAVAAEADNDSVALSAGVSWKMGSYDVGVSYAPLIIYGKGFSGRQLTLHPVTVGVSRTFSLGANPKDPMDFKLAFEAGVFHVFADPAAAASSGFAVDLQLIAPLTPKVKIKTGPTVTVKAYDRAVGGQTRLDAVVEIGASLNWFLTDGVSLSVGGAFGHRFSSISTAQYSEFSAGPRAGIKGQIQF